MRVPKRRGEIERAALSAPPDRYLTPAAIDRLKRQLISLQAERPAAIAEVQRTAEMGDFSENFAYQQAKQYLRRLNDRMQRLEETIKQAIVIEEGSTDGIVRIGSTVVLECEGKVSTFEILGSQETNPLKGKISYLSPLGAVLIGHRAGEIVEVETNGTVRTYRIGEVR